MRARPVENPHFLEFQATLLLSLAAAGLSIKQLQGQDLTFLMLDYKAWPDEPWRLFTACLLHVNYLHLAFNLLWTLRFGYVLEPIFGSLAMVGIFALLGMGSMAAEWAFLQGGIGLSGIGYGLFGLTWALDRYHPSFRGILDARTTQGFVLWFLFCILTTLTGAFPVANYAHGAGALLGGALGMWLSPFPKRRAAGRAALTALVAAIALLCTVGRPYVNHSAQRGWELAYDGYQAILRDDLPAAMEALEASTRRDPDASYAWHNLGLVYAQLGREADAQRALQRAEELEPPASK